MWHSFAARRTGQLAVSVLVLVTASFLMIHLVPGDPVRAALGTNAPPGLVSARRAALGLTDPLWLQYVHYIGNLVTGNLGTSISSGLPVAQTIGEKLPPTLELATYSFLTAVIAAVPVGLAAAVLTRNKRKAELAFTTVGVLLAAVPGFLLAVGMVYVFSVQLHWTPVAEESGFSSFVLPVAAMAIGPAAVLARILRLEVLAELDKDYVRTARAKRLPAWRVYAVHVLPNALTATLTVGGLLLSAMIAGTVLVENVFAWPGLGQSIVASITSKDYPLVQGIVLMYGAGVLLVNLVVDVALALLDPRSTIRES